MGPSFNKVYDWSFDNPRLDARYVKELVLKKGLNKKLTSLTCNGLMV
jgi:hypothetical protein